MVNSNESNKRINLIGDYKIKRKENKHVYKSEYNRLFPAKISSSNFLSLYTLFLLSKHSEPLYGKEMLNIMQGISNNQVWNPSHGTYYPLLEGMEADGLILKVNSKKSKNFYTITELGRKELKCRLEKFKPILIGGTEFFSKLLLDIYNERIA